MRLCRRRTASDQSMASRVSNGLTAYRRTVCRPAACHERWPLRHQRPDDHAEGRDQVAYLVRCALPANTSITKGSYTFQGLLGMAPQWQNGACDTNCQENVSACMLAHVNTAGIHVPLWIVAQNAAVGWGQDPEFPNQEGAFFGNVFTPARTAPTRTRSPHVLLHGREVQRQPAAGPHRVDADEPALRQPVRQRQRRVREQVPLRRRRLLRTRTTASRPATAGTTSSRSGGRTRRPRRPRPAAAWATATAGSNRHAPPPARMLISRRAHAAAVPGRRVHRSPVRR